MFCSYFKIDSPAKFRAIRIARELSWQYFAPFMTKVAVDMLPDLRRIIALNHRARVIFVGRDGFSLGHIVERLDPLFHNQFCREFHIARVTADAAVHEAELWQVDAFHEVREFRKDGPHRSETLRRSGWQDLVASFEADATYLDNGRAEFALIDSGYKGSIQEMLAAAFPDARFHGFYIFHGSSPRDPHPDSKKGYILHLGPGHFTQGRAIRDKLLDDPELTFAHHDAIVALEDLLRGSSDRAPSASISREVSLASSELQGINPILVAHEYLDDSVREAVRAIVLRTTNDYAGRYAAWRRSDPSVAWADLVFNAGKLRPQIHAWMAQYPGDPGLRRLLDSFVRKADKQLVDQLAITMQVMGMTYHERHELWKAFNDCGLLTQKTALVNAAAAPSPGQ